MTKRLSARGMFSNKNSSKLEQKYITLQGRLENVVAHEALSFGFRGSSIIGILLVLLLLSVAMNLLLSEKVYSQKQELVIEREWGFNVGRIAQPLKAHNLDGTSVLVPLAGDEIPTVLYIYSPQCIWSSRNIDNMQSLFNGTRGRYRVFGLALSTISLNEYILKYKLSFQTFTLPDKCCMDDLRIVGTPQTIVFSKNGQILKNWYGAYSGKLKNDVETFFGVTLPGIIMD